MGQKRIGDLLVEAGVLSREDLAAVLARQMTEGHGRVASEIFALGLAHERQLCLALATGAGHPALVLSESTLDLSPLALVPEAVSTSHALLPVAMDDSTVTVAVADVDSRPIFEQISFATGRRVALLLAVDQLLTGAISEAYAAFRRGERWRVGRSSPAGDRVHLAIARPPPVEELTALVGDLVEATAAAEPPPRRLSTPLEHLTSGVPSSAGNAASSGGVVARIALKRLAVPVVPAPEAATPVSPAATPAGATVILVVEDDDGIRDLVSRALSHDGYHVLSAASGTEAVGRLREHKPHLVLLDAMLPGMHGFELCARLKGSDAYRDVPVIMISAVYRGWQQAREIQEVHGADAFVEKPFDVHYVRKLIAELTGRPLERVQLPPDRAAQLEPVRARVREHAQRCDWRAALTEVADWLQLDPFDPIAHLEKGNLLSQLNDLEGALKAYEHAVVYGPSVFAAHANLALAYDRLGFSRKAAAAWRRARERAPDDQARARIDARLAQRA